MQPVEISGRVKAHVAGVNRGVDAMDTLAWMIGQYAGLAYHDPKKYPKKPQMAKSAVRGPDVEKAQDVDTMKTMLTAYAEVHNEIEKGQK